MNQKDAELVSTGTPRRPGRIRVSRQKVSERGSRPGVAENRRFSHR